MTHRFFCVCVYILNLNYTQTTLNRYSVYLLRETRANGFQMYTHRNVLSMPKAAPRQLHGSGTLYRLNPQQQEKWKHHLTRS